MKLLQFEEFKFNPQSARLYRGQEDCKLTQAEANLLKLLLANKGQYLDKHYLQEKLYGDVKGRTASNRVSPLVGQLRFKLGESGSNSRFIHQVPGVGYKWIHEIKTVRPSKTIALMERKKQYVVRELSLGIGMGRMSMLFLLLAVIVGFSV